MISIIPHWFLQPSLPWCLIPCQILPCLYFLISIIPPWFLCTVQPSLPWCLIPCHILPCLSDINYSSLISTTKSSMMSHSMSDSSLPLLSDINYSSQCTVFQIHRWVFICCQILQWFVSLFVSDSSMIFMFFSDSSVTFKSIIRFS